MSDDTKENIKKRSTWLRGLYMLLFTVFSRIAELVLFAIIIFQFILKVLTGNTNDRLRKLGQSLSTYIYQILQFLSFNNEVHPYPFGAWPKGEAVVPGKAKTSKANEAETPKQIKKD